ncbi:hypothetical protein AB4254_09350 [Vibrio breoganii]
MKAFNVVVIASLMLSFSGAAEEKAVGFDYNYFDWGVGFSDFGVTGAYSAEVHHHLHGLVDFKSNFSSYIDGKALLGFNAPVQDWSDLHGGFGYRYFSKGKQGGLTFDVGLRQWLGTQTELDILLGATKLRSDNVYHGRAAVRFHTSSMFSLSTYFDYDDLNKSSVGLVVRFRL